jgi:hypothetical protein
VADALIADGLCSDALQGVIFLHAADLANRQERIMSYSAKCPACRFRDIRVLDDHLPNSIYNI